MISRLEKVSQTPKITDVSDFAERELVSLRPAGRQAITYCIFLSYLVLVSSL